MNDFVILPKFDFRSEPIIAESKEDAMAKFAAIMDSDMNQYFIAVPASKVDNYIGDERWRQHVKFVTDWMKDVLMYEDNSFGISDEKTAQDIAEQAFEIYSAGNGYTEYESIEEACRQYKNNCMKECKTEEDVVKNRLKNILTKNFRVDDDEAKDKIVNLAFSMYKESIYLDFLTENEAVAEAYNEYMEEDIED